MRLPGAVAHGGPPCVPDCAVALPVLESKWHPHRCRIHRMFPRLKRLNGWQRIGVVLSVMWALYGLYWGEEFGLHQGDWTNVVYESCMDSAQKKTWNKDNFNNPNWEQYSKDSAACEQTRDKDWKDSIQYHWYYAAICSLVPIPLAWGIVCGLIALVKWVRRGFKVPTNPDSPPGR
jgi:hypothetical protein